MPSIGFWTKKTMLGAAAGVAFMLAAPIASTPASAQVAGAQIVQGVDVVGNQRIERETILSYMTVSPGQTATGADINNSLRALFETGLFRNVEIEPRGGGLVVIVEENPVINQIAFEGNRRISDEDLTAQIQSAPRRVYSLDRVESDAQTVLEIYRRSGRYGATVEPKLIQLDQNRVNLVFEIQEGPLTEINSIRFVGNSAFSERRLRGVISSDEAAWYRILSTTTTYDEDRVQFDRELLRRFYRSRGYADVEIESAVAELSDDRSGFFLTFTISEGPRYDFGPITLASQVSGVPAETVLDVVATRQGALYNADLVEKTLSDMAFRLNNEGYPFVQVEPTVDIDRANNTVAILYELVQGPRVYVERIDIRGNSRTLDQVIRREFELVEGDAFNAVQLQRSRSNIRSLNFFSKVDVNAREGSAPDRVVIDTEVAEKSTGTLTFGAAFSTGDGIGGLVSLTERNLLGRGQFLRLSAQVSARRQLFDLSFTEPYFLGRDLAVGFDAFLSETDNQDTSSYDVRNIGFSPRVSFPVGEYSRLGLRYEIADEDIRNVPADASGLIKQDVGSEISSSLGYTFTYDRRNDPVEPTGGYRFRLSQDFAGLGGDARHIRSVASGKVYRELGFENVVGSLEIEGGSIVPLGRNVRTQDRFHLGGDSFRGFEYDGIGPNDQFTGDSLGGNLYGVLRAEVTFPIGLPEEYGIYGGVFSDVGTIFQLDDTTYRADAGNASLASPAGSLRTIDDGLKLRATLGASLFWDSPIGPIRLNFATPIVDRRGDDAEFFRFTAGTRF